MHIWHFIAAVPVYSLCEWRLCCDRIFRQNKICNKRAFEQQQSIHFDQFLHHIASMFVAVRYAICMPKCRAHSTFVFQHFRSTFCVWSFFVALLLLLGAVCIKRYTKTTNYGMWDKSNGSVFGHSAFRVEWITLCHGEAIIKFRM